MPHGPSCPHLGGPDVIGPAAMGRYRLEPGRITFGLSVVDGNVRPNLGNSALRSGRKNSDWRTLA